ncbi:ATP-grasp domain-containing protein [Caenorhabditis elegans]|nr:ATP-grasp domain-containing protein [Caenorhabditis elegans]AAF08804.1 synapsin [Caenorhabditis elegans]CCD72727.1 ATP-grasp domain-containing protein [Caenorhabditis elegans]|eukprot:NP_741327.1 SyNapsiN [Caenorhabditis elegans]
MKDAKVLLVIDSHHVDWSKYFRNHTEYAIRVEQGDIDELDVMCTEKNCTVELNTPGKDVRTFTPSAVFLGAGATRCAQLKTITRAFIAAHIPFLNSHTSAVAFLDRNNLKKQLKKITLSDGASIPMLPIVHYPHFHKFHQSQSSTYPMVVSVNEGFQGIGKIKVNNHEELCDVEGMLQIMSKGDTEVEVQPFVDAKYDLHIQKIGHEYKTFIRRGICKHWKSNVGSSVLEQISTCERHKKYLKAITDHVGPMHICSIDILVSKEGREFVHDVNDVIAYFGESAEDDRRAASLLLRALVAPRITSPIAAEPPATSPTTSAVTNGHGNHGPAPAVPTRRLPPHPSSSSAAPPRGHMSDKVESRHKDHYDPPPQIPRTGSRESVSYVDDTMGQLKRTFAGFFGE